MLFTNSWFRRRRGPAAAPTRITGPQFDRVALRVMHAGCAANLSRLHDRHFRHRQIFKQRSLRLLLGGALRARLHA